MIFNAFVFFVAVEFMRVFKLSPCGGVTAFFQKEYNGNNNNCLLLLWRNLLLFCNSLANACKFIFQRYSVKLGFGEFRNDGFTVTFKNANACEKQQKRL